MEKIHKFDFEMKPIVPKNIHIYFWKLESIMFVKSI